MRLFLALNPPDVNRGGIWNAVAPMRAVAPDISWTDEPKVHVTLKFIGEQPDDAVAPLAAAVARVAATHVAPVIHVEGVGAFPNFRRPQVVWVGVTPEPRLELLHHDIEVACAELGHPLDGRPFRPHLTVGRVRDRLATEQLRPLKAAAARIRFNDEFMINTIDVMQSVGGPSGATYQRLASATMRS